MLTIFHCKKHRLTAISITLTFSLSSCSESNTVGSSCEDGSRNCYKINSQVSRVVAKNVGERPTVLPQLVGKDGEDLSSWKSFLAYLENEEIVLAAREFNTLESNDYSSLLKVYEYMAKNIYPVCSPGRRKEGVNDPISLVRDYGYGCCSNNSRAFAWIASYLGFEARVISIIKHEFPEIKVNGNWQIIDPDTQMFGGQRFFTLEGVPLNHKTLSQSKNIVVKTARGETGVLNAVQGYKGRTLEYVKSVYSEDILHVSPWNFSPPVRNPVLHPNESIEYWFHKKINGLQTLDADGQHTGATKAPDVGVVNYHQRVFEKSNGRWHLLPPYPAVREMTIEFDKNVNKNDVQLIAADPYVEGELSVTGGLIEGNIAYFSSDVLDKAETMINLYLELPEQINPVMINWTMQISYEYLLEPDSNNNFFYIWEDAKGSKVKFDFYH